MMCASDRQWSCTDALIGHRSPWQADQYGSSSSSSSDSSPGGSSTGSRSGCSPELQAMLSQERQSYRTGHTADSAKLCAHCHAKLVDWMVKAAHSKELQLEDGTLHLAVDMLDRFLSAVLTVRCSAGQLVGAACLWLASKYEEVNSCTMDDLCWLTSGTWTPQQLKDTEHGILLLLNWRLALPTAWSFHSQLLADTDAGTDPLVRHLSAYLLEISLICDNLLTVLPSCRASASLYLARRMLGYASSSWDDPDSGYAVATSYRECDLLPVAESIAYMHWLVSQKSSSSSKLTGSREHYAGDAHWRVANISSVCLDLVLATNNISKVLAGHCRSREQELLWQQQQQQSCDWQQQEETAWSWRQQQQQQYASWAWHQQHAQQQYASWLQQQQQQAHAHGASQQSLVHWSQQQQLQSYWHQHYQHYQQPSYWTYPQEQVYKQPEQWDTQQQQQQQAVSPWGQHCVPHQQYMQTGLQQQQQQQQQASYAPTGYAAYWPHFYCHRPAWMTAAAVSPAPSTLSQVEASAGIVGLSSSVKMTAAQAAGGFGPSPVRHATVDDLVAALCKAAEELTASMRQVSCGYHY